jgi:hypothetical protein
VLRNSTLATARHILRYDAIPDTTTAQEALVKLRLGDNDGRGPGVALRHTMNGTIESAYVAYLRSNTDQAEMNAFVNGTWVFVAAAPFPSEPNVWYWLRFRAAGSALTMRVWADGTAEPATWTVTGTNATLTAGGVGLYTYETNTVTYDHFGVATGGGTAPGSHGAPPPPPPPTLTSITVTPATATVQTGGAAQFQVSGQMSNGTTTTPAVAWTATGGGISAAGVYTAGATPGSYQVIATTTAAAFLAVNSGV